VAALDGPAEADSAADAALRALGYA
jgi:hypothetical protein